MFFNPKYLYRFSFWTSLLILILILIDLGFHQNQQLERQIENYYYYALLVGVVTTTLSYIIDSRRIKQNIALIDLAGVGFALFLLGIHFFADPNLDLSLKFSAWHLEKYSAGLLFLKGLLDLRIEYKRSDLNPAQLFLISFISIILFGTLLLSLPSATVNGISLLDALFTATSAVCVTGLIVLDTAVDFTSFGQGIILLLIQVGGLGILTFVSYFSYFFKGQISYEKQIAMSSMNSSAAIGKELTLLKHILLITLTIEAVSAVLIFYSVDRSSFSSVADQAFFAIFHAISAFCNAGFSTLSGSLQEGSFEFNYGLQIIVALTFILGGLGFPIVENIVSYLKYRAKQLFSFSKEMNYRPWVLNLNSRIALITSAFLTAGGFIAFYALEYHNTLGRHDEAGKLITAFFGAVTPRTAGFNTVDTASLLFPTTLLLFFLMWVGASPKSTGGGIKTTTFAIAILNIISMAKGSSRIEIFRREIVEVTIKRAFAMIALSIIVISIGIVIIASQEPEMEMLNIAFECVSAYSTVGLSMGITAGLGSASKLVLILLMFIGRVSALTVLFAIFRKTVVRNYRYPKEEITIH
ncbi:MAG: ATPase [Bacteroidetes bacterium]|nr:ATPase [Bacteroidota bacterium]MDA0950268.1 ATPase [Bacteroidota bacterium]